MQSWEERQLERMGPRFPEWDIWFVRYATQRRTAWCAKPKGTPTATLHADSADELAGKIRGVPWQKAQLADRGVMEPFASSQLRGITRVFFITICLFDVTT